MKHLGVLLFNILHLELKALQKDHIPHLSVIFLFQKSQVVLVNIKKKVSKDRFITQELRSPLYEKVQPESR